eukprot:TRINITY_DN5855_c0_g3_i1.p1 TRINITY_DN5855_c0_g3~~TRINITY_DN5855_c0_g3_i1.p1  ORF type:complete len:726 (+),score=215.69 TRINITY_DN5855_c0_g3_i1:74-2251(+)
MSRKTSAAESTRLTDYAAAAAAPPAAGGGGVGNIVVKPFSGGVPPPPPPAFSPIMSPPDGSSAGAAAGGGITLPSLSQAAATFGRLSQYQKVDANGVSSALDDLDDDETKTATSQGSFLKHSAVGPDADENSVDSSSAFKWKGGGGSASAAGNEDPPSSSTTAFTAAGAGAGASALVEAASSALTSIMGRISAPPPPSATAGKGEGKLPSRKSSAAEAKASLYSEKIVDGVERALNLNVPTGNAREQSSLFTNRRESETDDDEFKLSEQDARPSGIFGGRISIPKALSLPIDQKDSFRKGSAAVGSQEDNLILPETPDSVGIDARENTGIFQRLSNYDRVALMSPTQAAVAARKASERVASNNQRLLTLLKTGSKTEAINLSRAGLKAADASDLQRLLISADNAKILDLSHNYVGDNGSAFELICDGISSHECLLFVRLKDNGIGPEGMVHLSKSLTNQKSIAKLDLSENNLGFTGVELLSAALKENEVLEDLDLSKNNIPPESAAEIVSLFKKDRPVIKSLFLAENPLGDEGVSAITFTIIQKRVPVEALDFSSTRMGSMSTMAISTLLSTIKTLRVLQLAENQIDDEGATSLAEALTADTSLSQLKLSDNSIGNDGASAFANLLVQNKTLQYLYLDGNRIGDVGAERIGKALRENKKLSTLWLARNRLTEKGTESIAHSLQFNDRLKDVQLDVVKLDRRSNFGFETGRKSSNALERKSNAGPN